MAAGKVFEIAFAINAAMSAGFNSTITAANGALGTMGQQAGAITRQFIAARASAQSYANQLRQVEQNAANFATLKRASGETAAAFEQAKASCNKLATEFAQSKAQTDNLKAALDRAKETAASMKGTLTPATYREVREEIKGMTAEYNASAQRTKELGQSFEQAKNHAGSLKNTIASQNLSLQETRAALSQAGFSTREYAASQQALTANIARATQAQEAQSRAIAASGAASAARQKFSSSWGNMMSAGLNVSIAAAPMVGMIETAANFEAAMSKVQAITSADNGELQQLTNTARELGEKTQFSAQQSADAMTYLGMAGWNTEQIIAGMPGLLDLAAASGTDLARTADIVSDDLTMFGLSAEDAGHMADVFAVTANKTNTGVEMLGETMKYAGPVAHAFGVSLEETSALAGIMANSGIKASNAGTALRSGFLRLAGPPKMAQKAMNELGLSMSDITKQQQEAQAAMEALGISMSDGNGPRKMSTIITELRDKLSGLSDEEKLAELKLIFGTEAATGWLAVLSAGPDVFNDLVDSMENSDGAAAQMAEIMNNNARGAMIRLKSAAESVAISVGGVFLPAIANTVDSIAQWTGGLSRLATAHPGIITAVTTFSAAMMLLYIYLKVTAVASAAFRVVQTACAAAMTAQTAAANAQGIALTAMSIRARAAAIAQWALNAAMTANPVGLVIAAIAAIAAAIYLLYTNFDKVRAFMTTIWESPIAAILAFTNPITALMYLGAGIIASWDSVKEWFVTLWNDPGAAAGQFADFIGSKLSGVWNYISGIASGIGDAFSAAWTYVSDGVASAWDSITTTVAESAAAVGEAIESTLSAAWTYVSDGASSAWESITNAVANGATAAGEAVITGISEAGTFIASIPGRIIWAIGFICGVLATLPGRIAGFIATAAAYIATLPSTMYAAGVAVVSAAYTWLTGTYTAAVTWLSATVTAVWTFLASLPGIMYAAGVAVISAAYTWLTETYTEAVTWLSATVTAVWTFLASLPSAMYDAGVAIIAAAVAWLAETYTSIVTWLSTTVSEAAAFLYNLPSECAAAGAEFVAAAESWASDAYNSIMDWINQIPSAISSALSGAWDSIKAQFSGGFTVGVNAASNAKGGIYQKGAFLTTFAEEGPEAAIPLTPSPRAIGLWQRAGQILGVGGQPSVPVTYDTAPNARENGMPMTGQGMPDNAANNNATKGPATNTAQPSMTFSPPPITMELNFYGQNEPSRIKDAVEQAGRTVQRSFADQMDAYRREVARLAYE